MGVRPEVVAAGEHGNEGRDKRQHLVMGEVQAKEEQPNQSTPDPSRLVRPRCSGGLSRTCVARVCEGRITRK